MQMASAGAQVTALDLNPKRMARVSQNLLRCGLEAQTEVGDALEHRGEYDAILLDAPCTATGTMRRHPDLPYAKDKGAGFGALIELQTQMLAHAWGLLKSGGRMVYCTCSLLREEGEDQIKCLLSQDAAVTVLRPEIEGLEPAWRDATGGIRLRPDDWLDLGGMDGFYMAVLTRAGDTPLS